MIYFFKLHLSITVVLRFFFTVKAQCIIIFGNVFSGTNPNRQKHAFKILKKIPVYQYLIEKLVYLNVYPNTVNDKETVFVDKIHEF